MINVYNFKVWDAAFGGWRYPVTKATSAAIKNFGGKLIIGTNQKVSRSLLDDSGIYCPRKHPTQHGVSDPWNRNGNGEGGFDTGFPGKNATPVHDAYVERP
jgi:hypothetical protein